MYVSTYILSVLEQKKAEYLSMAEVFAEVAKELGAQEIYENWESDVPDGKHTDYRKAVQANPGEKIVMSWIVWPNKDTADKAHQAMFEDPRITDLGDMPLDGTKMILGNFEPILRYVKS